MRVPRKPWSIASGAPGSRRQPHAPARRRLHGEHRRADSARRGSSAGNRKRSWSPAARLLRARNVTPAMNSGCARVVLSASARAPLGRPPTPSRRRRGRRAPRRPAGRAAGPIPLRSSTPASRRRPRPAPRCRRRSSPAAVATPTARSPRAATRSTSVSARIVRFVAPARRIEVREGRVPADVPRRLTGWAMASSPAGVGERAVPRRHLRREEQSRRSRAPRAADRARCRRGSSPRPTRRSRPAPPSSTHALWDEQPPSTRARAASDPPGRSPSRARTPASGRRGCRPASGRPHTPRSRGRLRPGRPCGRRSEGARRSRSRRCHRPTTTSKVWGKAASLVHGAGFCEPSTALTSRAPRYRLAP